MDNGETNGDRRPRIPLSPGKDNWAWILFIGAGLGLLAKALNAFPVAVFPRAEFAFGDVFTLTAALAVHPFCGFMAAVLAHLSALSDGHLLWFSLFLLEPLVAGWLVHQRWYPCVASLFFWGLIGAPLILIAGLPLSDADVVTPSLLATVRLLNGLLNILMAECLVEALVPYSLLRRFRSPMQTRSFQAHLFQALAVMAIAPLFLLGLLDARREVTRMSVHAGARLKDTASAVARDIDNYLASHVVAISALARALNTNNTLLDDSSIDPWLASSRELYPGFLTMLVADSDGFIIGSSPALTPGDREQRRALNVSDRDYFQNAMEDNAPYLSGAFLGRGFGHDPIVAVSAPLNGTGHEPIGIVEGSLDLRHLKEAALHYHSLDQAEFVLMDRGYRVVFASHSTGIPVLSDLSDSALMRSIPDGKTQPPFPVPASPDDTQENGYLAAHGLAHHSGWHVVVRQPMTFLSKDARDRYQRTCLWMLTGVLLALAGALALSRRFTRPLTRLVQNLSEFDPNQATVAFENPGHAPAEFDLAHEKVTRIAQRLTESYGRVKEAVRLRDETNRELHDVLNNLDEIVQERTQEIVEAKVRAEEASIAKGNFLANMSHEIRTPIHGIHGLLEIVLNMDLPAQARQHVMGVQDAAQHLLTLVNEVLDLSKAESGNLRLDSIPVELEPLVFGIKNLMLGRARAKHLSLRVDWTPTTPRTISGNPGRIRQVLLNLTGNAIKFTERGSITLRVSPLVDDEQREWLRFEVRDTGPGIPEAKLNLLFKRFSQVTGVHIQEGTGLGLAISKELVHAMGGKIGVQSREHIGSTFWVEIPLIRAENRSEMTVVNPSPPASPGEEAQPTRGTLTTVPPKVMVVDDSKANLEIATAHLNRMGIAPLTATHGRMAVELARDHDLDLILMDFRMPEMEGTEAARAIKAMPRHQTTRIVGATASSEAADIRAGMEAGMCDVLHKPFSRADLINMVARHTNFLTEESLSGPGANEAAPPPDLDLSLIHHLCGEDQEGASHLIGLYAQEIQDRLVDLSRMLDEKNLPAMERAAHTIKSAARTLGALRLAEQAEIMESQAREHHLNGASQRLDAMKVLATALMKALDLLPT